MSPKNITLLEGAYLIGDAHYSELRPELLGLIEAIHSKKILPTQLVLMGDIFDALFGDVAYTLKKNHYLVRLLNEISQDIEVIYLEGNHDFNLKEYFPHIDIFSIDEIPAFIKKRNIKVSIVAVPAVAAQEIADLVIKHGVKALLNFAPVKLNVPDGVHVHNADLTIELQSLIYYSSAEEDRLKRLHQEVTAAKSPKTLSLEEID